MWIGLEMGLKSNGVYIYKPQPNGYDLYMYVYVGTIIPKNLQ